MGNQEIADSLYMDLLTVRPLEGSRLNSYVYASDISKCIRQTYYKMVETPLDDSAEDASHRVSFVLDAGNAYENLITERLILLGLYRGRVRVSHSGLLISGETDPIIEYRGKKIITEIKATHRKHYTTILNNLKLGNYPELYVAQLQAYLHLYEQADFGVLIICNRDVNYDDKMPPFLVIPIERDENWKKINWSRLERLKEAVKKGIPPDREFEQSSWQCKVCPYNKTCYSDIDA